MDLAVDPAWQRSDPGGGVRLLLREAPPARARLGFEPARPDLGKRPALG